MKPGKKIKKSQPKKIPSEIGKEIMKVWDSLKLHKKWGHQGINEIKNLSNRLVSLEQKAATTEREISNLQLINTYRNKIEQISQKIYRENKNKMDRKLGLG